MTVVAGIVGFYPDRSMLTAIVGSIAADVAAVVYVANSPLPLEEEQMLARAAGATPLEVIRPGANVGLGTAYNEIAAIARARGAAWTLLLDQDSLPSERMVPRLIETAAALEREGHRVAAVGPHPVTASGELFKVRPLPAPATATDARAVEFIISSGSIVSMSALATIGEFRADFFIDAIDIEWCLRAWHAGCSVWIAPRIVMTHRLGRGYIRIPFGLRLTDQPPERIYTYIRNHLAMLRLPHVSWRRKLVTAAYLPVKSLVYIGRSRMAADVTRAVLSGYVDGVANRLGEPNRVWQAIRESRR
jgi:rhamnosyltransferase